MRTAEALIQSPRAGREDDVLGDTAVLLYDGDCGFCAGSVQFVLRHESEDRRESLRFAPLQGAFGTMVRARFPEIGGVDSLVWYDPNPGGASGVLVKSSGALQTLAHVGGAWRWLAAVGRWVPGPVRDLVYDLIARRRFELAAPACILPSPETRGRFLA